MRSAAVCFFCAISSMLVVVDGLEIEAVRRRGRAGVGAGPALQEGRELRGRLLEHRADERPDHVAEKAVGGYLELERVAAAVPRARGHGARDRLVLSLRRSEGLEVVLADDQVGRVGQLFLVERPRIPVAAVGLERRGRPAAPDAVAVAAGAGRMARVE